MGRDYRDFHEKGSLPAGVQRSGYWWTSTKEEELADLVIRAATELDSQQKYRSQANLRHARLYGNFDSVGWGLRDYSRSLTGNPANRVSLNAICACADTLTAKIAKNRPRPSFQTFGGKWSLQRKAKLLNKFTQGLFYETQAYRKGRRSFLDACVFGLGAKKIYVDGKNRICTERTSPEELRVDDADGVHGTPRQMFQTKAVQREVVLSVYGKADKTRNLILAARGPDMARNQQGFGDMLQVREAWHLPSEEGADDGRHVIAIDGAVLLNEEWTKPYFPFAFMRFSEGLVGFWGQGLAERLMGLQLEINRILRSITEQIRRSGKGRMLMHVTAEVPDNHVTNAIGDVVRWGGQFEPKYDNQNTVRPEEFQQLDRLWTRAFEETGISQLSAQAKKPEGLDSGKALREFNDIESERFVTVGQDYESFYMDEARIMIDLARDVAKKEGGYSVNAPSRSVVEAIDWKHIDLRADEFEMQCFPVSSLPTTPAARKQEVMDLLNGGFISSKAEALRLMDMPDVEASNSLAVAQFDYVDHCIEEILDGKEAAPIDDYVEPSLIVERGNAAYLRAKLDGAPDTVLEALWNFVDRAAEELKKAAPPPSQPGMGAPLVSTGLQLQPGASPGPGMGPPPAMPMSGAPPMQ